MAGLMSKVMQVQLPMVLEKATPQIEARLKNSWKQFGSQAVMSQIPVLIEQSEPQIEAVLRTQLQKMTPDKAALFLQNWRKLDAVVQQELGQRSYGGKRKTRRRKSRK